MLKVNKIETQFGANKSEHILYSQDESKCLVVIFPGGNNSSNRPILHYTRSFALENNCDVLNVSYTNLVEETDPLEVKMDRLSQALYDALQEIESEKKYVKRIFIARSFGNIISNKLKIDKSLNIDKSVYISPTSDAVKYFDQFPGFIITATNDNYIPNKEVEILKEKYKDNILVFEDGTHALQNENIEQSLDFLKTAVITILDYIDII